MQRVVDRMSQLFQRHVIRYIDYYFLGMNFVSWIYVNLCWFRVESVTNGVEATDEDTNSDWLERKRSESIQLWVVGLCTDRRAPV